MTSPDIITGIMNFFMIEGNITKHRLQNGYNSGVVRVIKGTTYYRTTKSVKKGGMYI